MSFLTNPAFVAIPLDTNPYFLFAYGGGIDTTSKYYTGAETTAAGATLPDSSPFWNHGCGSTSAGYFGGSYSAISTRDKYIYQTHSSSTSTSLATARDRVGAVGTTTKGYWAGGNNGSTDLSSVETLTYSGETTASGTALTGTKKYVQGVGNTSVGLFCGGYYNGSQDATNVVKYTYSGDTTALGTALSTDFGGDFSSGITDSTAARILRGNPGGTDKYTYSGDTVSSGTNTSLGTGSHTGSCNTTYGIFAANTTTKKYTYSGESVGSGTALTGSGAGAASCSATNNTM